MKLPITLSFYITKIFIFYLLMVIFCFAVLVTTIDAIEILRRIEGREIAFFRLIEMIFLKFPIFLQDVMPFIVLVASVLTYAKLAKTNELVIVRSAGISALEFIFPTVITAIIFGILVIVLLNPVATSMANRYETLKTKYFHNSKNKVEISDSGFWVKQIEDKPNSKIAETIINSKNITSAKNSSGKDVISLNKVFVLNFDSQGKFIDRIDSEQASLVNETWLFEKIILTDAQATATEYTNYSIPTNIKAEDLQKSLSDAEAVSFWQLPKFIKKLQDNGFSAASHILQFHKILSAPLFYAAMVMIGAIFTLKSPRISKGSNSIAFSIVLGFLIYFVSNLIFSLGLSGSIPIVFSAWVPIMIAILAAIYLMLHLEDG
jgi:lipopolysaccharide export system permease protein